MDPPTRQPGAFTFGIKSVQEVERDGTPGLLLQGWASRYEEVDLDGEFQARGSLIESIDTWALRDKPPILYNHGRDPALRKREIGYATDWRFDDEGLFVESFIPRDYCERWTAPGAKAAKARFRQVYNDIKAGACRGYSVGGEFTRIGKALLSWIMDELTVTPTPCLPTATFTLGAKALTDEYGAAPAVIDESPDEGDAGEGAKAAMKSEPDGKHPASHYLFVPDPTKPSTWKLRVKNADGQYDRDLCGNAHAALTAGFRGNKVTGVPKAKMLAKLKRIYTAQGWDWPDAGSGGKIALLYLEDDHPDTYAAYADVLTTYTTGAKAGRRFSTETLAAVRRILDQIEALEEDIEQTFGVADADDADAAAAPGTTPLIAAS